MPIPRWTQNAMDRIGRAVSWVERQPRFRRQPRARWHRHPTSEPVRCCLAEDHPGRGIVFTVHVGTWNPATHGWAYAAEISQAIDWWYSDTGPYPPAGATGIFIPRPSDEYGIIYAAVSGDCDSPGSCWSS